MMGNMKHEPSDDALDRALRLLLQQDKISLMWDETQNQFAFFMTPAQREAFDAEIGVDFPPTNDDDPDHNWPEPW